MSKWVRRNNWRIIYDMLRCLEAESMSKTWLMMKANLSWEMLNRYIDKLLKLGLIKLQKGSAKTIVSLTHKGRKCLQLLKKLDIILGGEF